MANAIGWARMSLLRAARWSLGIGLGIALSEGPASPGLDSAGSLAVSWFLWSFVPSQNVGVSQWDLGSQTLQSPVAADEKVCSLALKKAPLLLFTSTVTVCGSQLTEHSSVSAGWM
jgi:hypothetical protein